MANEDVSDIDDIDDGEHEEPYNLDEIRSSVVGLTDQANDEVWMSFVRQQLGTLFPDFFQPDAGDSDIHAPNPTVGFGSLDGRIPGSSGQGSDGWEMVQDGAHHRPMTMVRQGEYGSVPNVREEISGLREEIERLRGVVGGLASGLFDSGMIRGGEADQVQQKDQADQTDQADQVDQEDQADQAYQAYQANDVDQGDQADQADQDDQADHARHVGQGDQADYVEQAKQSNQADSADEADQADQMDQTHLADLEREDLRPRQVFTGAGQAARTGFAESEQARAQEVAVESDDGERQDEDAIDDELGILQHEGQHEDSETGAMSSRVSSSRPPASLILTAVA